MDDLRSPTGEDPANVDGTGPEWSRELPDVTDLPLPQLVRMEGGVLDNSLRGLLTDLEQRPESYSAFGSVSI